MEPGPQQQPPPAWLPPPVRERRPSATGGSSSSSQPQSGWVPPAWLVRGDARLHPSWPSLMETCVAKDATTVQVLALVHPLEVTRATFYWNEMQVGLLHRPMRRQALPARGLLQDSRSNCRQCVLHAMSPARAARRCVGGRTAMAGYGLTERDLQTRTRGTG
jgi:hypothetical protein